MQVHSSMVGYMMPFFSIPLMKLSGSKLSRMPWEIVRRMLAVKDNLAKVGVEELELLVFSVTKERYAIEPAYVLDVAPVRRLTVIPGTPAFVLGVMNHMGRLRPVLDLRRILDPGGSSSDGKWVVTVDAAGMSFCIICDAVIGMVRMRAGEIAPAPAALGTGPRGYVRGVTTDMVTVLDLEALTRDARIVVNDEVG